MAKLNWIQDGSDSVLKYKEYLVKITQDFSENCFDAKLYNEKSDIILSWEGFSYFNEAEEWALFAVVETEQGDALNGKQRILEAFDICRKQLDAQKDYFHIQRLYYIQQWYFTGETQSTEIFQQAMQQISLEDAGKTTTEKKDLSWEDTGNGLFEAETVHGKAIIREARVPRSLYLIAGSVKHRAYIEHPSGARITMGWEVTDFSAAEEWIHEQLHWLTEPRVAKECLENILFTLDICILLLQGEQDIFLAQRVRYVRSRAEEVLP